MQPPADVSMAEQPAPRLVRLEQARAFLLQHFGDAATDVTRLGHGEWSDAYAFKLAADHLVVRFSRLDEDFLKDQRAQRFAAPDLPVPRISEIGEAFGGFYAVSERVHGEYLDTLDEGGMRALLPSLFATLDAMRVADVGESAGYGLWDGAGMARHGSWPAALLNVCADRSTDRIAGWRERLAASPVGLGSFEQALARLESLVDCCPSERSVIHADLLNFNVFVCGKRISALIDWGCAMYGDFLYELAGVTFWQFWYPSLRQLDLRTEARRHYERIGLDVPHFEERLRCYELHIGLAAQAYLAWAGRWTDLATAARRTREVSA